MFTRQIYDKGAYSQSLYEWKKPGNYLLLPESNHRGNSTCFHTTPEIHPAGTMLRMSDCNDMADIESDLFNIIRKRSKDPLQQYPFVKPKYRNPPRVKVCGEKREDFDFQYAKLDGSQWNRSKSIQVPRFESLCLNPQRLNRIRSNNVIGTNTRLFNRDTHVPKIPVVYNQDNLWKNGACVDVEINSCMPHQNQQTMLDYTKARQRDYRFGCDSNVFDPTLNRHVRMKLRGHSSDEKEAVPVSKFFDGSCKNCAE